jgi:hypothetical protein
MQFDYLTDESEKSLAPFFSALMVSVTYNSLLIMGGLLLLFWPREGLFGFIGKNTVPLLSFQIFAAATIVLSYVNFRCGRGELFKSDDFIRPAKERVTHEKERNFFRYTLVEFLLHTLFLLFPFLPLLVISSSISGISIAVFVKSTTTVFTAAILCRLFAFTLYLLWGRSGVVGYLFVRMSAIFFLFVTVFWVPAVNPIWIIYGLNKGVQSMADSYSTYMAGVVIAGLFFATLNHLLVRRHIKQEKTT